MANWMKLKNGDILDMDDCVSVQPSTGIDADNTIHVVSRTTKLNLKCKDEDEQSQIMRQIAKEVGVIGNRGVIDHH